jgi:carbon starvation protein CstA
LDALVVVVAVMAGRQPTVVVSAVQMLPFLEPLVRQTLVAVVAVALTNTPWGTVTGATVVPVLLFSLSPQA